MPAGRPPTFEDGSYHYDQLKEAFANDFTSEKDLCAFIKDHIKEFARDIAGIELASFRTEYSFGITQRRILHSRRIDFLLVSDKGERIGIECKHPHYQSELSAGVGQCLGYIALFEAVGTPLNRMIIVSSKIDTTITMIIHKFNLPISFVVMDRGKFAVYNGKTN